MQVPHETTAALAAMIREAGAQTEIEIRMKCTDEQVNKIVCKLYSNKKWSSVHEHQYVDHLCTDVRMRFAQSNAKPACVSKTVQRSCTLVATADWHDDPFVMRIASSTEAPARQKSKKDVHAIRSVQRLSFVHKDYIRFDVSKVVQTAEKDYTRQMPSVCLNEVEIELIGRNAAYDSAPDAAQLYAESMLMKGADIIQILGPTDVDPSSIVFSAC